MYRFADRSQEQLLAMMGLTIARLRRRQPPGLFYETLTGSGVGSAFLTENEVSRVLRITYSTGIKNRFSTVENNIPPTIAVPTECRPSLPAPVAKYNGRTPNTNANEVIRMGRNRNS